MPHPGLVGSAGYEPPTLASIPTAAGRFAGDRGGEWRGQTAGSQPFATLSKHLNSWMNWHTPFYISLFFAITG